MEDRPASNYRRGYEPSAPPLSPDSSSYLPLTPYIPSSSPPPPPPLPHFFSSQDSNNNAHDAPSFDPFYAAPPSAFSDDNQTLAAWLVETLVDACKGLLKTSHSVVSLDLRRAVVHSAPPESSAKRRRRPPRRGGDGSGEARWLSDEDADEQQVRPARKWIERIETGSAQLKILQVWDFRNPETGEPKLPWDLNLGIGLNFQIDSGKLEPKLRIRGKHASLHILPQPLLELRGKWPLANTGLAIDARYRLPLDKVAVDHGFLGAQLMVNLFNPSGTGFHLTPGGLEFDEQVVKIGKYTRLRVAAAVQFPRKYPVEEGDNPLRIEVRRLGLKTTTA